ncbi:MAG TPA: glycosyltransferase [Candidatus Kapabacteria bacterium]|nr:glycosyltransferase [Candidatus Kapabacteria bacterium]
MQVSSSYIKNHPIGIDNDVNIFKLTNRFENSKPIFTLVVPVLQEDKILAKHLSKFSLGLREEYNIELIVSDGGSTDKSVEIAKIYADTVVVHNKNNRQTISEGRNNGAYLAKSDVLVFLNGDTTPVSIIEFIDNIIKFSEKYKSFSKYDALACFVSSFPQEEKLQDKIFNLMFNNYVRFLNFINIGMGRGECQIVRKEIFEKVGGFNTAIVAGEDFDLFRRVAKIAKIKVDKKVHVYESPRRFRKYGYIKTIAYWMANAIFVMLFNKSLSKEWEAVR